MKQFIFLFSFFCLVCFSACDIVQPPFTENNNVITPVDDTAALFKPPYVKRVLLEEFTGFTCPNCPDGAKKIEELSQTYKDSLIVISIHAGDFARPYPSGSKFRTDFRTEAGNTLNGTFSSGAYPAAVINRVTPQSEVLDKWSTIIDTLLNGTPHVHIGMKSTYNEIDSSAVIEVGVKFLKAGGDKERLAIYMVEDSVVDWQLDLTQNPPAYPNGENPSYVHRHVMRGDIADGAWGRLLDETGTTSIAVNTKFTKGYTYSFKGKKYKPEHCHAIAFVYDENTKRIRQAAEVHIKH